MALYHEAASVLDSARKPGGGSIKSIIYGKKTWKSDPKTLFALSTEAAKWSQVLAEVVGRSGVLGIEKNLTPTLALVLVHDLFLAKKGVALPASHGLHAAVARHKARLSAELTKARLRRGCPSLDALRVLINEQAGVKNGGDVGSKYPRWIRVNALKTTLDEQLTTTFADYVKVGSLAEVTKSGGEQKPIYVDEHVPNLIAVPANVDVASTKAYKTGCLILQDKASCFPAYLLDVGFSDGDVIDACAAPGNKTTHLAAILNSSPGDGRVREVIACEKDAFRSQTLEKMVKIAGGEDIITVKTKQDFMKLNPDAREFANVTALLLDPSCSGSGIVGRDEGGVTVHLPTIDDTTAPISKGKKRKRGPPPPAPKIAPPEETAAVEEETPDQAEEDAEKLRTRLANLSGFQLRLLERAMAFPAARRITYSTCSVHAEENEDVVVKALQSQVARERGWRISRREEQVEGMRKWARRGWSKVREVEIDAAVAEACIRCVKGSEEGTMGFFVAGFVRDEDGQEAALAPKPITNGYTNGVNGDNENEDEWDGFGDT